MSLYVFFAKDRPGAGELRAHVREAHRARLRQGSQDCRCIAGGPLTTDAGEMDGTLLVLEAPDRAAAQRFIDGDPYVEAKLFEQAELHRWTWTLGAPTPSMSEADR